MRLRGRVVQWTDRGFGFARIEDGGADAFIHMTALPAQGEPPAIGQSIECDVVETTRGRRAEHVAYVEECEA
jgi:cold shock CspA family protein